MLFIFLLPEQKKNETKRKFAVCIFLPTPVLFSAKEKELATLKQLFLFNAPKSTSASRQKKEAGPWCFCGERKRQHRSARWSICFPSWEGKPPTATSKAKKTPTSTSEAMLSPPLENRPLVEEREEFFALSREEEKAVWAIASSFSLGKEWKI